jgi:hypothetical protein
MNQGTSIFYYRLNGRAESVRIEDVGLAWGAGAIAGGDNAIIPMPALNICRSQSYTISRDGALYLLHELGEKNATENSVCNVSAR